MTNVTGGRTEVPFSGDFCPCPPRPGLGNQAEAARLRLPRGRATESNLPIDLTPAASSPPCIVQSRPRPGMPKEQLPPLPDLGICCFPADRVAVGAMSEPIPPGRDGQVRSGPGGVGAVGAQHPAMAVHRRVDMSLYADVDRGLPVADPDGREMLISCGAALFNVRLALRSMGYIPQARVLPDPGQPALVAQVSWPQRAPADEFERAPVQPRAHAANASRGAFAPWIRFLRTRWPCCAQAPRGKGRRCASCG